MEIAQNIADLFCSTGIESITENNIEYICKFKHCSPFKPNSDELKNRLKAIPSRDSFEIDCDFENQDNSVLSSTKSDDINSFLSDLDNKLQLKEESDSFYIQIKIHKNRIDGIASVYSLKNLVNFWSKNGIVDSFKRIQELSCEASTLRVFNLDSEFQTNCLLFTPFISETKFLKAVNREGFHSKRDIVGHFSGSSQYDFIPDDFNFRKTVSVPEYLKELFNKLILVSSLVYLCDFTRFSGENNIHLRLNGYRLFSRDLSNADVFTELASIEYFEIYKWVFSEGNIVDKIGLARNILSLHLDDNDLLKIQNKTLHSISSGYQIYLKDNVKQYIEIKNKLSEFIQNSSDKASEIVKNVGSYYKGSVWTMYSFFMTVLLIEVVGKNSAIIKSITHELYLLFIAFFVITIIVMNFALNELESEKDRLVKGYRSLVKRYEDLLLEEDLSKVLGDDRQHNEDIAFIEKKRKGYRNLWLKSLGVIFIVITLFWYTGNKVYLDEKVQEIYQKINTLIEQNTDATEESNKM